MKSILACCSFLIIVFSCNSDHSGVSDPEALYNNAHLLALNQNTKEALDTYEDALVAGLPDPMRIFRDTAMRHMLWNPDLRPRIREMLRRNARDTIALMAPTIEPGPRIQVLGKVINGATNQPVAGAVVELVQADTSGQYFPEEDEWNPRLFAYFKTGRTGTFVAYTIMPGPYPDDDGEIVPRHIHYNISAPGYRDFNAEFVFEGDPVLTDEKRDDALSQGHPLATRLGAGGNYRVEIPLQRE